MASSADLSAQTLDDILALCGRAYGEDLRPSFFTFTDPTHVMAFANGSVVSHAMWVTRWLAPGPSPPLRAAYVEAVATDPSYQGRGLASAVMRVLVHGLSSFQLAALCPSDRGQSLYERLGWERWRGRLFIRQDSHLIETPDEAVMIHRLPASPPVNLDAPLSAEWRPGELW